MADVAQLNVRVSSDTSRAIRGLLALNAQLAQLSRQANASHNAVRQLSGDLDDNTNAHNRNRAAADKSASSLAKQSGNMGHFTKLVVAGTVAVVALFPVLEGTLAVAGGLTSALVSASAGAGAFALAVRGATKGAVAHRDAIKTTATELKAAKATLKQTQKGTAEYGVALAEVNRLQQQMHTTTQQLTSSDKQYLNSLDVLKKGYNDFIAATSPQTLLITSSVMVSLGKAVQKLVPLVSAVAPVAESVAKAFDHWVSTNMEGWVNFFAAKGVPILYSLITIGKNVGGTFGALVKQFSGFGQTIFNAIAVASAKMQGWAAGGGFARFMDSVKQQGPAIGEFFKALGGALANLVIIMRSLGTDSLSLVTIFLKIIAVLPVWAVDALVRAFIALRVVMAMSAIINTLGTAFDNASKALDVMKGACIGTRIELGLLWLQQKAAALWTSISTAVYVTCSDALNTLKTSTFGTAVGLGYLWLQQKITAAWTAVSTAAQYAWLVASDAVKGSTLLLRVELGLLWLQQKAAAVWSGVVTAAQWAWNASLYGCPILLVVALIAALVAAIIWVATKTTWFQTAWTYTWNFIKQVTNDVWQWLLGNVFYPIGRFFTQTIPGWAGTLRNAVVGAWNSILSGILVVWNWLKVNIFAPIGTFFVSTIPGWAVFVKNAIVSQWNGVKSGLAGIWNWIKSNIFSPIGNFFTKTIPGWASSLKDKLITAFNLAKDGIHKAWSLLEGIFKAPIKFMIDVVYNKGIVGIWNKTAGKLPGIGDMKEWHPKGFAAGGHTGPGSKMTPAGIVHADEFVVNKAARRKVEGNNPGALDYINNTGRLPGYSNGGGVDTKVFNGGGPGGGSSGNTVKGGKRPDGTTQGNNGINIPGALSKGFEALTGGILDPAIGWATGILRQGAGALFKTAWNGTVGPLKDKIIGNSKGSPALGKGGAGMVDVVRDKIVSYLTGKEAVFTGGFVPGPAWKAGDDRHVNYGGVEMNIRTMKMVQNAEKLLNKNFSMFQGSYSNSVGASAGTHSGGGAVDVGPAEDPVVGAMRASGFAAWRRTPAEGFSPHVHGIAVGDPTMSSAASAQVTSFMQGRNGLANNGPDTYKGGGVGGASQWSGVVMQALAMLGEPTSKLNNVLKAINKESGGNPNAVNNWDSNARAGMASVGLLQVIPPTFQSYAGGLVGRGIRDPLANIYSAIKYARATYGGGWDARMAAPGGYYTGGLARGWSVVGEKGPELINAGSGSRVLSNKQSQNALTATSSDGTGGDSYHFSFNGAIIASDIQLEDIIVKAVKNATRKKRL